MLKIVHVKEGVLLEDYGSYASIAMELREMLTEASKLVPLIKGKKIWMINSTEQGGGVAEMMPRLVSFIRQLGVECDWVVASTNNFGFFDFTKKLHNLIHGHGDHRISSSERELYEEVNRINAEEFSAIIKDGDIVVINDPQPLSMAEHILKKKNVHMLWRCHIGLDGTNEKTDAAWGFLRPYLDYCKLAIFTVAEYVPGFLFGKSSVIHPTIDPLDHKNRYLSLHKIVGVLSNCDLVTEYNPIVTPDFLDKVQRLQSDGTFSSPLNPMDPGLLFRPYILQVSRWDKLKGYIQLMKGFIELKKDIYKYAKLDSREERRLELTNLVLAGPDPDFVADDPEGKEMLKELTECFVNLPPDIQNRIMLLKLPMSSRKNNELIVNALQRASTIVLQNSINEGFGLTVTEAMWKVKPVIGSGARGLRMQIREGIDGLIIEDPTNIEEIAYKLNFALSKPKDREVWAYNAEKRVVENFLIFTQVRRWLRVFAHRCSEFAPGPY